MRKKLNFLMLTLITMIASISLSSCDKVDDALTGEEYYIQLTSVDTNLINEDGQSLGSALKSEWISANKASSDGKKSMGRLTYENAEKAFSSNINSMISQFNDIYAGKNLLPEGGYIDYNFSLVSKSEGPYSRASIRVTNSGAN